MTPQNAAQEINHKLIFGLKLRQLRLDKGLLLSELAHKSGISVSYLNEIEKGKKFPKPEKIGNLAEALDVSYDWLISIQMKKSMAPVAKLLQSNILNEFPLDVFGIDKSQLLEVLSGAPVKLNAFLTTLIEISRNYGMRVEHFYFSALRSYLEMQENYFEDIELVVDQFIGQYALDVNQSVNSSMLIDILHGSFGYVIDEDGLSAQPELESLKAVLLPGQPKRLLLNKNLSPSQKTFILAKEIGFEVMLIKERPLTTTWVEIASFEHVLNNFRGSYFAYALLLNKSVFLSRLKTIFSNKKFEQERFQEILLEFVLSPETLLHRLTSLLPRFFGIQELFFLRFNHETGSEYYDLTKEIHLSGLHNPHTSIQHEHYCRRWIAINILDDLSDQLKKGIYKNPICRAQRSKYFGTDKEYLIISFAKPSMPNHPINNSISVGMLLTEQVKRKIKFWNDPSIPIRMVGETCERCPATDCLERKAPPIEIIQAQKTQSIKLALSALAEE
jgi:XRE family transcriptional regulator, fatty acid utilization regulator